MQGKLCCGRGGRTESREFGIMSVCWGKSAVECYFFFKLNYWIYLEFV